jgi:serralysin
MAQMATTIGNLIMLDGQFADWPGNTVASYDVYGALVTDATLGKNYLIGIDATVAADPVIAANTFVYLNTDQNTATGFSPFGSVGAEYYVQFAANAKVCCSRFSIRMARRRNRQPRRRCCRETF